MRNAPPPMVGNGISGERKNAEGLFTGSAGLHNRVHFQSKVGQAVSLPSELARPLSWHDSSRAGETACLTAVALEPVRVAPSPPTRGGGTHSPKRLRASS